MHVKRMVLCRAMGWDAVQRCQAVVLGSASSSAELRVGHEVSRSGFMCFVGLVGWPSKNKGFPVVGYENFVHAGLSWGCDDW